MIIGDVDHNAFDLEWAKCGGVCAVDHAIDPKKEHNVGILLYTQKGFVVVNAIQGHPVFIEITTDIETFTKDHGIGMATPDECAYFGVEYIEKPVSAEELAELRKNSARLDYLAANCLKTKMTGIKIVSEFGKHFYRTTAGFFETYDIREAIDAVMDDENKADQR